MPEEFESGMFVRTPAWHGNGNVVSEWPGSWEAARVLAGIEWDVYSAQLELSTRTVTRPNGDVDVLDTADLDGWQAIVRNDTDEALAITKDTYALVTNQAFGDIIEFVLADEPGLKFDAVTSLKGGRSVTATMLLDEPITVPGDPSPIQPFINFSNNHDGLGGLKIGPGAIRIVCANTQRLAEGEMDNSSLTRSIRHTSQMTKDIQRIKTELREHIKFCRITQKTFVEHSAFLAETEIYVDGFEKRWMPLHVDYSERSLAHAEHKLAQFRECLDIMTPRSDYTSAWNVLQAATEADQHLFPVHAPQSRITKAFRGGSDYTTKAKKIVLDMAGVR
jgi:phage/plasmid-like protein (TIGR03299 family)